MRTKKILDVIDALPGDKSRFVLDFGHLVLEFCSDSFYEITIKKIDFKTVKDVKD